MKAQGKTKGEEGDDTKRKAYKDPTGGGKPAKEEEVVAEASGKRILTEVCCSDLATTIQQRGCLYPH